MSFSKPIFLRSKSNLIRFTSKSKGLVQYNLARMASSSYKPPFTYVSASELADQWRAQGSKASSSGWTIIDVRDDDFEGGHIKGCRNIPSTEFPEKVKELVKELQSSKSVVFHCSLSQQRGPKAARIYKEARQDALESGKITNQTKNDNQRIAVLRDGFANFGSIYKNDADLVEEYDEESWKYR